MNKLTLEKRIILQAAIHKGVSRSLTCSAIDVNSSTIYREIINYSKICFPRKSCNHCIKQCTPDLYNYTHGNCSSFVPFYCERLRSWPYVCNGCSKAGHCKHLRRVYDCEYANKEAKKNRSISRRKKKKLTIKNIEYIDSIVSPGVFKGQSIHHIYVTNPGVSSICSEQTVRRLIYARELSAKPFDLRKYVRIKRNSPPKKSEVLKNPERLFGRSNADLIKHMQIHPNVRITQFDSMIGKINDKQAILTITLVPESFQFGIIIEKGRSYSVLEKIRCLQNLLGSDLFKEIMPVLQCDNGTEFASFEEAEITEQGEVVSKVFFTRPNIPTDKAKCERYHGYARYVIPKGRSLDSLTQDKVNLMFSHINSFKRKSLNDKSPYELIIERFGPEFLSKIGIEHVHSRDVLLKPILLK